MFISRYLITVTIISFFVQGFGTKAVAEEFNTWLDTLKIEARSKGISQSTIESSLSGIKPIPRVIELDRKQPEFTLTFEEYLGSVVSDRRIRIGKAKLIQHKKLLAEISIKYGVQPRYIVALWGIETDFGRVTGGFPVIDALVTLSYDGRRSKYFSKELINALKIIDQGHISYDQMVGSWAGAMGQTQFMPSSFLNFAQDYDNDGRKDIWGTKEDALASAANYLSKLKWNNNETWGREVIVNDNFNLIDDELTLQNKKTIIEWQSLGVRRMDGRDLPKKNL